MYQRKTRDEFQVLQYTGSCCGWEEVYASDDRFDARARLREYRENQPEFPAKLNVVRIPIQKEATND